ncbi:hypothetical protein SUGI_0047190 [Cryptomeria japonica]|nr:hypothetical protein SUGI_0047190 [Cryptomeria japonica]
MKEALMIVQGKIVDGTGVSRWLEKVASSGFLLYTEVTGVLLVKGGKPSRLFYYRKRLRRILPATMSGAKGKRKWVAKKKEGVAIKKKHAEEDEAGGD